MAMLSQVSHCVNIYKCATVWKWVQSLGVSLWMTKEWISVRKKEDRLKQNIIKRG